MTWLLECIVIIQICNNAKMINTLIDDKRLTNKKIEHECKIKVHISFLLIDFYQGLQWL